MNEPDNTSQADEAPKLACAQPQSTFTIAPEQLCGWLETRRDEAIEARRSARKIVERMSYEIAAIDRKIAELKIR